MRKQSRKGETPWRKPEIAHFEFIPYLGIDLSRFMVGQTLRVTPIEARLLVAEGWAEPLRRDAEYEPARRTVTPAAATTS